MSAPSAWSSMGVSGWASRAAAKGSHPSATPSTARRSSTSGATTWAATGSVAAEAISTRASQSVTM